MKIETQQQIFKLFYANGKNNRATIEFYEDPGHGWCKIPRKLAHDLGFAHKISGCSYEDKDYIYLEEDCDFALFIDALDMSEDIRKTFIKNLPRNYTNNRSIVRSKSHYTAPN
jgi:hypothetical protein